MTTYIPENKQVVYEKVDITIGASARSFSAQKSLRRGDCFGVKIVVLEEDSITTNAINVGVSDVSGNELIAQTDYRDYTKGNGAYLENFKPVSFNTDSVNVNVTSPVPTTRGFKAQFIFALLIDKQ